MLTRQTETDRFVCADRLSGVTGATSVDMSPKTGVTLAEVGFLLTNALRERTVGVLLVRLSSGLPDAGRIRPASRWTRRSRLRRTCCCLR